MGDLRGAISVWGEIGRNAAFLPLPSRLHILVEKTLQEMRNCVFTSSVGLQLQATKNNQYHLQKHFLHPHRHSSAIAWTFPNFALYQSNPTPGEKKAPASAMAAIWGKAASQCQTAGRVKAGKRRHEQQFVK